MSISVPGRRQALPAPHSPHGSIWPLVAAFGIFLLAVSLLITLANGAIGFGFVVVALLVTVAGSIGWWSQLIHQPAASPTPQANRDLSMGMVLFIASEVAFFAAFFIGYFYLRGTSLAWPPPGTPPLGSLRLPMLNTIVLAVSGLTLTAGHAALRKGNRSGHLLGLAVTIGLGVTFLMGQAWEWRHAELTIHSGTMGSAFYLLTGFHGMHVAVGVLFLGVNLVRSLQGAFSAHVHDAVTFAGWYWHFVDAVWLLLFVSFYLA
jgi:cytochrome c oxidase subunit 3